MVLFFLRYGGIPVAVDISFDSFEQQFRHLLPSVDVFRMRPPNDYLLVSFKENDDFLVMIRAASSVNVFLEIGWLFDSEPSARLTIGSCFLKLYLSNGCMDERLVFLLDEVRSSKDKDTHF